MLMPRAALVATLAMGTAVMGSAAMAQNSPNTTKASSPAAAKKSGPVNAVCPSSGKPIVASAGTVEHDGYQIGFCCPGCMGAFKGWDDARKTQFVQTSLAAPAEGDKAGQPEGDSEAAGGSAGPQGRPYTLDTCALSGEKLGSMGDPVVKEYDGREIKFCCDGCVDEFEENIPASLAKVDEAMIAQQLMHYPLDTCAVRGGKLGSMGEPVNMMYDNRLVRFCCAGCVSAFKADPEKYFAEMDRKIIAAQAPAYPLTECPVGGHGPEGGAWVDVVSMNRLVRLCCEGCEWKLHAEPAKYLAKLDKAYADAQRDSYPMTTCPVGGEELDDSAVEIVAGTQLVRLCCEGCVEDFAAAPDKYLKKIAEAKGK